MMGRTLILTFGSMGRFTDWNIIRVNYHTISHATTYIRIIKYEDLNSPTKMRNKVRIG